MRYSWNMAALLVAGSVLTACGDKDTTDVGTDADGDGFNTELDCDDSNAAIYPGADELCDGIDNSCSGEIDDDATDGTTFYADGDGDGYGDANHATNFCDAAGSGYVANSDDCDDGSAYAYPGGSEVCDGLDNDCDGTADNDADDMSTWFADADGDGYGDRSSTTQSCTQPTGYTDNGDDCDDTNADLNPDATWYPDTDFDGYGDEDKKGLHTGCQQPDGYVSNGDDCNDSDRAINPDAEEICDGADSNCDGKVEADDYDDDKDGQAECQGDCDDTDATVYQGGEEVCDDGLDNDCSDRIDDGCAVGIGSADVSLTGPSSSSYFGYKLSAGGDVNGDGQDDLAVGAYNHEESSSAYSQGVVFLFHGPMTAGTLTADSDEDGTITGEDSYDYIGYNVDITGDVNGDGYDDVIVEGYGDEGDGGSYNGSMYLFHGPVTGFLSVTDADAQLSGANTSDYFGQYVTQTADLDNDGKDEVIGNIYYNGGTYSGGIAIFSEPSGFADTDDADTFIEGSDTYTYTGRGFTAGDFSGDGVMDVAYGEVGANQGFIINGPIPDGDLDDGDADVEISNSNSSSSYTASKFASGDFNGDGYTDLAIGNMYSALGGVSNAGMIGIYEGPLTSGGLDVEGDFTFAFYDTTSYNNLGAYYDGLTAADLDDDGNDDLIVGQAYYDAGGTSNTGAVHVHYGPAEGVQSTSEFGRAIYGNASSAYLGRGVTAGDLDGNGVADLVGGAYYNVNSYYGGAYVFFDSNF